MIDTNLLETLSNDLSKSINPVRFAQSLGFNLDAWQRDLLLSNHQRVLLLAARQVGKSTACSLLALQYSLNNPDSLILVLSPSLRQSSELYKCITGFYRDSGRPVPAETETALTLKMTNGSRIVRLPSNESTIRGFGGVNLLIIDEAALVPDSLYFSVRPMLAVSEGRLIAMGTPHGRRGWFYETWVNSDEFKKIKITADQCPRISQEFLAQERRALGRYWFDQEYNCKFHQSETSLFRYDVIQEAVQDFDEIEIDLGLDDLEESAADYANIGSGHSEDVNIDLD